MKKSAPLVLAACGLIGLSWAGMAMANNGVGDEPESMMVSPSTIVLAKVNTVTVHTNIPYGAVVPASIRLDGAKPAGVRFDSLGHLVAKFRVAALDLSPGKVTLTLRGDYRSGDSFAASDRVTVK